MSPDVRRALDALAYIEKMLERHERDDLDQDVLLELRQRARRVQRLLGKVKLTKRKAESASKSKRIAAVAAREIRLPTSSKPEVAEAVHFEARSCNRKLGPVGLSPGKARPHFAPMRPFVSTTTVSIQATCSDSCPFKATPGSTSGGCFTDSGFTRIKMQKMDAAAWHLKAEEVIAEEARRIDAAFRGGPVPQDGARGGRDLRLHIGGDAGSTEGAQLLAQAAARWRARGGGTVWSYTHNWRDIPRSSWGEAITIFASVEAAADIEVARKAGYPAAIVLESFPNGAKAFSLPGSTARIIPCPAETLGRTCAECRLCLDRDLLNINAAIAFKVHGQQEATAREALIQLKMPGPH